MTADMDGFAVPREFYLGGTRWRVRRCAPADLPGEYGHCDFEEHVIRLQRGLAPDLEAGVFFHELVHAMLWMVSDPSYADEAYVTARANMLHQFFKTAKPTPCRRNLSPKKT